MDLHGGVRMAFPSLWILEICGYVIRGEKTV